MLVHEYRCHLICLLLITALLGTFWPVLKHEFVKYDDDKYVTENPHVVAGVTLRSVVWAFSRPHYHMWHPLTSLSHMLDYEVFGPHPLGHHLTSLLLHIANTLLMFLVLRRLTGAVWQSAFVAAVFGLHPLQVESVAWVAERKNVLSSFFWLLTLHAYVRYVERRSIGRYLLTILAFCGGLMAKPIVVVVPFVLLLLDYWPLGRLRLGNQHRPDELRQGKSDKGCRRQFSLGYLIAEKVPMAVFAALVGVITLLAQRAGGTVSGLESIPLGYRVANAFISYLTYIEKLIWPSRLAVLYPHPGGDFSMARLVVSVSLVSVITVFSIYVAHKQRYLVVGWLWYLGTLVPVIGLVQVGAQARADRYMYMTMIGLLIVVAWGLGKLAAKWRYRVAAAALLVGVVLSAASARASLQLRHWRNSTALFKHTLGVTDNNYVMHNNYGYMLLESDRADEAIAHFEEAVRINPRFVEAYVNIGVGCLGQGRRDLAVNHWRKVVELKPDSAEVLNNLGWVLAATEDANYHNSAEAVKFAERACALTEYGRPEFLDTLAAAYAAMGRFAEAVGTAERAIKLAEAGGRKDLAREIRKRLLLYRSGQPYREQ